jgi:hypothetical protein
MNTEELKSMIQLYFDGELEKNKEAFLFISLSQDTIARDYFKSMNLLNHSIEETKKEFPQELEKRIFYSLKNQKKKITGNIVNSQFIRVISYSLVVILIILNIYLLGRLSLHNDKMNSVESVVEKQNKMIELLFNSLPITEIKAKWENEIIVKSNL